MINMNGLKKEARRSDFLDGLIPYDTYAPIAGIDNRNFWDNINPELKSYLVSEADKYLGFEWKSVRATDFIKFFNEGSRIEKPAFSKRYALASLVMGECVSDNGKYMNDIVDGIWSICEESTWAVSAHINSCGGTGDVLPQKNDDILDLFALEAAQLIAFTYYVLFKRLAAVSGVITKRMKEELYSRAIRPYLLRDDYWWMGFSKRSVNNWNPWCNSNIIFTTALAFCEDDIRKKVFKKAFKSLDVFLAQYPDDGSCDEGASYWFAAGGSLLRILSFINTLSANKLNINNIEKIKGIAEYSLSVRICDNYYINFADAPSKITPDIYLIYRIGEMFNDDRFKNEARELAKFCDKPILPAEWYSPVKAMDGLIFYDDVHCDVKPSAAAPDIWLGGTQLFISRSSSNRNDGFYLAAKGGTNGESHNHNDVGSFIVYRDGKRAVIDVGVGTYTKDTFSEKRYTLWNMQSQYHNLPVINGSGEHEGTNFAASSVKHSFSQEKDRFSLNIADAYEESLQIRKWNREFILNRSEDAIVITDEFSFRTDCDTEIMFMMQHPCTVSGNTVTSGNVSLSFESRDEFSLDAEEIKITDKRISADIGDVIYRLHVHFAEKLSKGKMRTLITAE